MPITNPQRVEPTLPTITATVAASALTIGASSQLLAFRSATLTSGGVSNIVAEPSSLVVPSTATLGTVSAIASRLVVLEMNNAGTAELAVVNLAGSQYLDETTLITTTILNTASDSANVIYSTTARSNLPFRIVGYIESTQATAGTWATAPSTIQGAGGLALPYMPKMQLVASQATTSGTSIDFTGIPAWAKRITFMFDEISTNGTSLMQLQLGAGSYSTSGYLSSSAFINGGTAQGGSTTGLVIMGIGYAVLTHTGLFILSLISGNKWVSSGSGKYSAVGAMFMCAGQSPNLGGTLERIRLTTVGGVDTFDSGSVNLLIEGY